MKSAGWGLALDASPVVVKQETLERLTWAAKTPDASFRLTVTQRSQLQAEDLFALKVLQSTHPTTVLGAQGDLIELEATWSPKPDPKYNFNASSSAGEAMTGHLSVTRVPVGTKCLLFLYVSTRCGEQLAATRGKLLANLKASGGEPYAPTACQ